MFDAAGHSAVFRDKPAGAVVTSIHFYDHMAVNWLRLASEDRGMNFLDALSPMMMDLTDPKQRQNIRRWGEEFLRGVREGEKPSPLTRKESFSPGEYRPEGIVPAPKTGGKRVIVLADSEELTGNLDSMVETFVAASTFPVEVLDIRSAGIRGGCIGCCNCGFENACSYTDGFPDWYREKVRTADAVIIAAGIRNRGWGSFWKTFHDRTFFQNHAPEFIGKQVAYLISGSLAENPNFREELEGRCEVLGGNLAGIATDETESSEVSEAVVTLARRIGRNTGSGYRKPMCFLGTGGTKIFRDYIYLQRFLFRMDYKSYKKNGMLDFPQRNIPFRIVNFILRPLMHIGGFRKVFQKMMPKEMASPLRGVVRKAV